LTQRREENFKVQKSLTQRREGAKMRIFFKFGYAKLKKDFPRFGFTLRFCAFALK